MKTTMEMMTENYDALIVHPQEIQNGDIIMHNRGGMKEGQIYGIVIGRPKITVEEGDECETVIIPFVRIAGDEAQIMEFVEWPIGKAPYFARPTELQILRLPDS